MARVITFSRFFLKTHPEAGKPTHFVESFLNGTKKHTIRSGNRWSEGDKFSPRYWSNKPYRSKQTIISEDTEVKKVYDFKLLNSVNSEITGHDKGIWCFIDDIEIGDFWYNELVKNDGFTNNYDFYHWFNLKDNQAFTGQLICWDDTVQYL